MRRPFLIIVGIFVLIGTSACQKQSTVEVEAPPIAESSEPAIAAAASDLPQLGAAPAWSMARLDGSTLSSADMAGKVVVVDFWAARRFRAISRCKTPCGTKA